MAQSKSLKGTKTERLLAASYMAETQAFARYTFYAKIADKEKLFPIGVIFRETAQNEIHHAKVFLKHLENAEITEPIGIDAGFLGSTADNLRLSMKEESEDGYKFYKAAAKTAKEEGFQEVSEHFAAIAAVEKAHYDRFARFLEMLENDTLWKREKPVTWKCLVCGFTSVGKEPPAECPGCDHPKEHYVALDDGYVPVEDF